MFRGVERFDVEESRKYYSYKKEVKSRTNWEGLTIDCFGVSPKTIGTVDIFTVSVMWWYLIIVSEHKK